MGRSERDHEGSQLYRRSLHNLEPAPALWVPDREPDEEIRIRRDALKLSTCGGATLMAKDDKYFTFPLSVLRGGNRNPTALSCLELAVDCGIVNAGKGVSNRCDQDEFIEELERACEKYEIPESKVPHWNSDGAHYLVGAKVCGVTLPGGYDFKSAAMATQSVSAQNAPFLRMSSKSIWAALDQARHEADHTTKKPERGLSWREFRVLAAILSWPKTKEGFTSPGWESIQFRACGFVNKEDFKKAKRIPDHLPKLSRRQIRDTLDTLEALEMFARFRLSTGPKGGRMFYSFRHSRDELAQAACQKVNFQDRAKVAQNRAEDSRKCLELLERAKSGTSQANSEPSSGQGGGQGGGQAGGQGGGQGGGQHNEKSPSTNTPLEIL